MKFKAGDCVELKGMTKEQHAQVCRWFIESGATPVQDENYLNWDLYKYVGYSHLSRELLHQHNQFKYHSSPTIYTVGELFHKEKSTPLPEGITQVFTTVDGVYFDTIEAAREYAKAQEVYKKLNNLLYAYVDNSQLDECIAKMLEIFNISLE